MNINIIQAIAATAALLLSLYLFYKNVIAFEAEKKIQKKYPKAGKKAVYKPADNN